MASFSHGQCESPHPFDPSTSSGEPGSGQAQSGGRGLSLLLESEQLRLVGVQTVGHQSPHPFDPSTSGEPGSGQAQSCMILVCRWSCGRPCQSRLQGRGEARVTHPEQARVAWVIKPASRKDGPMLHTGGCGTGTDIVDRCGQGPGGHLRARDGRSDEVGVRELLPDCGPRPRRWSPRAAWSCHWSPPWQLRRCLWSWPTPVRYGTLPGPLEGWPRPMLSTRRSWPTSLRPFVPPCALCETPRPRHSTPWPPADTR